MSAADYEADARAMREAAAICAETPHQWIAGPERLAAAISALPLPTAGAGEERYISVDAGGANDSPPLSRPDPPPARVAEEESPAMEQPVGGSTPLLADSVQPVTLAQVGSRVRTDAERRVIEAALTLENAVGKWIAAGDEKVMHVLTCAECERLEKKADHWCAVATGISRRQLKAAEGIRVAHASMAALRAAATEERQGEGSDERSE